MPHCFQQLHKCFSLDLEGEARARVGEQAAPEIRSVQSGPLDGARASELMAPGAVRCDGPSSGNAHHQF